MLENGDVFQGEFHADERVRGVSKNGSRSPDRIDSQKRVQFSGFRHTESVMTLGSEESGRLTH